MVNKKNPVRNVPTLKLKSEHEIAMDFATKVYKKFEKAIKSIILFGSTVKKTQTAGSDIDIIIVIDDASIKWDQELTAWYRQELGAILGANPYSASLHINTVKLTTWWQDLMRGDPIILNILRNGEALVDMAGFFDPLKFLLIYLTLSLISFAIAFKNSSALFCHKSISAPFKSVVFP